MRMLAVADGIWPPAIEMKGLSIVYKQLKEIATQGIEVHVLVTLFSWTSPSVNEWFIQESQETGIRFHAIDFRFIDRLAPRLHFYISKLFVASKVLQLHSKFGFDIIHEYSSAPLLLWRTSLYPLFDRNLRCFHTLCTYNTGLLGSAKLGGGLQRIEKVICITQHLRDSLLANRQYPSNKVVFLPLGVDRERFLNIEDTSALQRQELEASDEALIVLYIGPLEERKGVFTLAHAAEQVLERFPQTLFVIATCSSGTYTYATNKNRLLAIMEPYQEAFRLLEGIHDVPRLMKLADVFVLPQVTPHGTLGYPLTLLEAMSAGKAVVASDTFGVDELIQDEVNGLLFPAGDEQELANQIAVFLSQSSLRKMLAANARNSANSYDINLTSRKLLELYRGETSQKQ